MQQNDLHHHGHETGDVQEGTKLTAVTEGDFEAGEFRAGDVIDGAYEVLKWIGSGGMGNVYCVRHSMMQQEYALKTLSADKVTEVAWRRFQNEAQAIARMQHPGIVAIYNLGLHDGRLPYYVMDLLKGQSLMEFIRIQGPLEVNLALSLFAELCGAFGYAHKKGIVHRDIKPANIVLLDVPEAACQAKIVDFGIAKLSGIKDPKNQFLTSAGEICGSPYYMSPEQTNGERIDARSDIYSLGCTLFEVLTGVPPLRGRSALETMLQHQTTTPPSLKAASGGKEFPEMLESVMATLLAKAPMDRYQTMELVAQDLSSIIAGAQTAISPYASQSPKLKKQAPGAETNSPGMEAVEGLEQKLGQRLHNTDDRSYEDASKNSPTKVVVITCVIFSIMLIAAVGIVWWQGQLKPKTAAVAAAIRPVKFEEQVIPKTMPGFLDDRPAEDDRQEENKNGPPTSLKDTAPFSQTEINAAGQTMRVFKFPTDVVIGHIEGSNKAHSEVDAKGSKSFAANEKIIFSPNRFLLKYPQYLSRFREGDIYRITIDGSAAGPAMIKHIWQLPGVAKLALINCPGVTTTDLDCINKMTSLSALVLDGRSVPAATLTHLTKLRHLQSVAFNHQGNCAVYLKLIKDSTALTDLDLGQSTISRLGFEYIAQIPHLETLWLDEAIFSPPDLQVLVKSTLSKLSLEKCTLDAILIHNIKKMKNTRQLQITDNGGQPMSYEQVCALLAPIKVFNRVSPGDAIQGGLH